MTNPTVIDSSDTMLKAMSVLSRANDEVSTAKCYALSCFHNYSDYFTRVAIENIREARKQLDRAEELMLAALPQELLVLENTSDQ